MTAQDLPPPDLEPQTQEIDLYSQEGPYSLFRLLNSCPATQKALSEIPLELLEKTEYELLKKPDDVLRRLKISFWNEFRRCQRVKTPTMVLSNVLFGVCSQWYWQRKVVAYPDVFAWLVKPPTAEMLVWQELLELGQKKLRRVLKLPLVEKRYWKDRAGEVHVEKRANVSLIKEIRTIVEGLQNRIHGSVVQRSQIEAKSLHMSVGASTDGKSVQAQMEDINELLGKIEKVAGAMPGLPEPVLEGEIADDPEPT